MKNLLKYFNDLTIHPKNAAELKGLILQLAVQGKLTSKWREDNPNVESASVLLERIQEEKSRLVQDKMIKKEKPLPKITEDEIPYKLPRNWGWCRLNEVCEYIQRGKSPKYTEVSTVPVVSQKCVQWSGFDISRARFITEESLVKYAEDRFLQEGDLLWNSTGDGTIGRVISFPKTNFERVVADSHVTVVRSFKKYVLTDYLWIFTASPLIQSLVAGRISGSTKQTELGTGTVKMMEFSFPPLEEQKAIVSIVNSLFAEVEQLEEQTKQRIQLKEDFATSILRQLTAGDTKKEWKYLKPHFATFFTELPNIKKLRESILQLAVQGKLTTHWRSKNPISPLSGGDAEGRGGIEHASVLLERIKAKKAQLVKEKKIKKEKPLPVIKEEEIPYELPAGWVWCRLSELTMLITKGSSPKWQGVQYVEEGEGVLFVTSENVGSYNLLLNKKKYVEWKFNEIEPRSILKRNDLLMNIVGGSIGRTAIYDIDDIANINQAVTIIRLIPKISFDYFLHFFNSPTCISYMYDKQVDNARPNLSMGNISNFLIPLPSPVEQQAIVERVNTLMALCDQLE